MVMVELETTRGATQQPPSQTRIIKRKFVLGYASYICAVLSKPELEQFNTLGWNCSSRTVPQSDIDFDRY